VPFERPHPSEEWNPGPEIPPRVAASVIVLRDSTDGPEVLLVQRNPNARFMGGAWVFPGGAVDSDENVQQTALRELAEEAAVHVADPAELTPFSRWITPAEVKIRFDTWFFVVRSPDEANPEVDGGECVDLRWSSPRAALEAHASGDLPLVFPTFTHLEELSAFAALDELIAHARARGVHAVLPRVVLRGDAIHVLLPGEPGYDRE